ncbi:MAG: hypothetical protein JWM35_2482 [Verrucomicrobia bacterium]|nr:hypothetical protein [Verrucomicrobiota bacterium]
MSTAGGQACCVLLSRAYNSVPLMIMNATLK